MHLEVNPIPLDQFASEMLELYKPSMRSKYTRQCIERSFADLTALGVQTTEDITDVVIARFIANQPAEHSRNTVIGKLRYFQTICTRAERKGYLRVSPFYVRPLREWLRPTRPRHKSHLTRPEIRSILDVLASDVAELRGWGQWRARRLQALVATIAYTGMRRGEALWLQVADVDLNARVIEIVDREVHRTKTEGSAAPVVIPEALTSILQSWLSHRLDAPPGMERAESPYLICQPMTLTPWTGGISGNKPLDRLKAIAARAGVQGATFHGLRRSLATHLESHGAGPAMIQRVLRHSDSEITMRCYRKADIANMRDAISDFDF